MKNLLITLIVASMLLITSCGKDDEAVALGLSGSITYNGTTTDVKNGLIINFGADGSEFNYDFYLSDGTIDLTSSESNGTVLLYVELYNEGSSFSTGTFTYGDTDGSYIETFSIVTSAGEVEATGGTVTVTGSGSTYKLVFNLEFADEVTLTGTVDGTYVVQSALNIN